MTPPNLLERPTKVVFYYPPDKGIVGSRYSTENLRHKDPCPCLRTHQVRTEYGGRVTRRITGGVFGVPDSPGKVSPGRSAPASTFQTEARPS